MIRDIVAIEDGKDLVVAPTDAARAANIVSTQLGYLEYANGFGVDLAYFLSSDYEFQLASFQAYLVNRLAESQVNVAQCLQSVESLMNRLKFDIGENNQAPAG